MLCLCIGGAGDAAAAQSMRDGDDRPAPQPRLIRFDIPRQTLQAALAQYNRLSRQSLLYDHAITEGKMAGPLQGEFTPEAALQSLLAGTGVVIRPTSQSAFMLLGPSANAEQSDLDAGQPVAESQSQATARQGYYARLQAQIMARLCADPQTIPGRYRLAASFWVGPDRIINRVLLHSTGDAARDKRIDALLTGMEVQGIPPIGLIQPITMVVLPRASVSDAANCPLDARQSRSTAVQAKGP